MSKTDTQPHQKTFRTTIYPCPDNHLGKVQFSIILQSCTIWSVWIIPCLSQGELSLVFTRHRHTRHTSTRLEIGHWMLDQICDCLTNFTLRLHILTDTHFNCSCFTGDMGVGKSCLLHQFTEKKCNYTCLHFT